MIIYISPSDFAFLYKQSKWGFHQKCMKNIRRPFLPMPGIFNVIDAGMKEYLKSTKKPNIKNTDIFNDFEFKFEDAAVCSRPIVNSNFPDVQVCLRGKLDGIYTDGSDNYLIDLKTSFTDPDSLKKYNLQLNSYAFALQNPYDEFCVSMDIYKAGLIVYEPESFSDLGLMGGIVWHETKLNLSAFEKYIQDTIIPFLAGPEPNAEESDPFYDYLYKLGFRNSES